LSVIGLVYQQQHLVPGQGEPGLGHHLLTETIEEAGVRREEGAPGMEMHRIDTGFLHGSQAIEE
jgi:hypothetical protein